MAIALAVVVLTYCAWEVGKRITVAGVVGVCVAMAMAVNIKFTGLLMVPIVGALLLGRAMLGQAWPAGKRELAGRWKRVGAAGMIFAAALVFSSGHDLGVLSVPALSRARGGVQHRGAGGDGGTERVGGRKGKSLDGEADGVK